MVARMIGIPEFGANAVASMPGRADGDGFVAGTAEGAAPVLIDCDTCVVRGTGCTDCVVSVLLGGPPDDVALDSEERRALRVLADAGLVPPLRMSGEPPS